MRDAADGARRGHVCLRLMFKHYRNIHSIFKLQTGSGDWCAFILTHKSHQKARKEPTSESEPQGPPLTLNIGRYGNTN